MAITKRSKPMLYDGQPTTFPTFASQILANDGTPLFKDGKSMIDGLIYPITALELESMTQEQQADLYAQGYRAIVATYNETVTMHALAEDGSLAWVGCNQDTTSLLDNPDFANAQAGYGGMHGAIQYAADRWRIDDTTSMQVSQVQDGVSVSPGFVVQTVSETMAGKNATLAVNTSGGMVVYNVVWPQSGESAGISNQFVRLYTNDNDFVLSITQQTTISNAALYEGSYTAKTLPPWVAPDPVAELRKCLYYYETIQIPVEARIIATMNADLNVCKFGVSYSKKRISSPSIIFVSPIYSRFIVPGKTIPITGLSIVTSTDNAAYIDATLQSPPSSPISGYVDAIGTIGISADL